MNNAVLKLVIVVPIATALFSFGCSATSKRSINSPVVAVAVSTQGGAPPTAAEVARIHQALQPELTRAGFSLAADREAAAFIVSVTFTRPSGIDGERVKITGFEPRKQFHDATNGGDTPEAREVRRRQREYEQWVERQARSDS